MIRITKYWDKENKSKLIIAAQIAYAHYEQYHKKKPTFLLNSQPSISKEDFHILFKNIAEKLMTRKREFIIDGYNLEIIDQFWRRISGIKGSFSNHKGLMLLGAIGCGKTLLMKTYLKIGTILLGGNIHSYHAISLANKLVENIEHWNNDFSDFTILSYKHVFIDDIGKEPMIIKYFGDDKKPITDLLLLRYDLDVKTYVTSNYNMNTLSEKYGKHTVDRFKEMFNIYVLKGESRRK